jgi:dipeptidyl-peptidase-4
MQRFIATIAWVLCIHGVAAQPPKLDADYLRRHAQTRGFMLGRPVRPQPTPDGSAVLFLRSPARSAKLSLYEFNVATGKTRELVTPEQLLKGAEEKLSAEEKARRERMRVSAAGFTSFQLSPDGTLILVSLSGKLYVVDRTNAKVEELATGPGTLLDPKFSPAGNAVSYVREHDVYVIDFATLKERAVTLGGTEVVAHGLAEFVAQEEMGRFTGYWWSPDSRFIAYQQSDHKGVETWYVADPIEPGVKPTPFFYPRPGKRNVAVKLGVVPVSGGPTTWLQWDAAKYPYLANVHWPKDGPLLVTVQTRDQREVVVLRADRKTGATAPLVSETSDTWVNLHQDVPRWLPGDKGFLWVSERAGRPQLELLSTEGKLKRVLVPHEAGLHGLVSVDKAATEVVYAANPNPTQSHLHAVSLAEVFAEPVKLSDEPGLHTAEFAKDHSVFAHTARLSNAMPATTVRNRAGKELAVLPSVAEEPPAAPAVELFTVGERKFNAAVVWPRDFDNRKRYPVMVDVYGGPHSTYVSASRQRWLLNQWYADQGFIVVCIDGRGTPGRGVTWERAIYRKFGSVPLEDQVAGLQALAAKHPAMDLSRVGIKGWSFGGYMGALAVMRRPDVFHAGVAGAPVCDWHDYDTHYTERYLGVPHLGVPHRGVPPAAHDAYAEGSLLTYAGKLERPLMILHGTADDNVYFRHSLRLVDALFRHGKRFEMVPLSGLTHMVPDPSVMERLHTRMAGFLKRHLGAPR